MSSETPANSAPETAQTAPATEEAVSYKVFRPAQSGPASPPPELPDSYFQPTAADLQLAQAQLSARTQALTEAPFKTKAAREAEEKAKRERWPTTRIRVKFPDGTQLEKHFPSTDRIKPVYVFVRSCLRDDVKPIKFILYQPPRRDLKNSDPKVRDLSLAELQLAPSSVLLLRFEDPALNHPTVPAPLLPSVLSLSEDLPAPPNFDAEPSSRSTSGSSTPAPRLSSSTLMQGAEKKVPKWFKMGSKK
ncbi:hypothetical protein GLOTRDRAFT_116769 [Gloeophyllum trabeum ATCC 11539]|uniref:UBX domain-containing protein n=1 Tax=Gloeophyllum trabeum (strain ATCC 11539 / FP-39264 / Madison 617) TaxID=670483 RepID=S7Q3V8_GLOTA|nr:uncharacterized protein GLOTRDRAFT_116769 [Gloeophyllum trabeum ATCC 11539]EPQ54133.1 hypothetical protein GLOTRDRAFT_116769 [Gloeophyllum trabeum ATCC 11539]